MRSLDGNNPADIQIAAACLRNGGIGAFPTETVYGLGADALNERAVAKVFAAKERPLADPLIVHIVSRAQLAELAAEIPAAAEALIQRFWPGPLTLVVRATPRVPGIITAGLPTVAIRWPAHPLAQELIRRAGTPIAAPSANRFGRISPTTAGHVREQFSNEIDFVLDGGACQVGVESTILSLAHTPPAILRQGGVPQEQLEQAVGTLANQSHAASERPLAPGGFARHYAPRTKLELADPQQWSGDERTAGVLCFSQPPQRPYAAVEVLAPDGDLCTAAAGLYAAMHRLDALKLSRIVAEPLPEHGLGRAINDRLRRAAAAE